MTINSPQFERNLAIMHSCVSFVNKALYTCYLHSWTKWKLSYFSFEKTWFNWGKFKLCVINLWIFTAKLLVPNIHQNFLNLVESQKTLIQFFRIMKNATVCILCTCKKQKFLFPFCNLVHPRLDLVNVVVRPLLFTKLSLLTESSLNKE